ISNGVATRYSRKGNSTSYTAMNYTVCDSNVFPSNKMRRKNTDLLPKNLFNLLKKGQKNSRII
ncbi:MAG: hypothetical protein ACFFED_14785, partial [Candidatus Thorarchaeota archaeon]